MKIYFDFDNTLIRTRPDFIEGYLNPTLCEMWGIDPETLHKYIKILQGDSHTSGVVSFSGELREILNEKFGKAYSESDFINAFNATKEEMVSFYEPNVLSVLEELKAAGHELGLFTEAFDVKFQMAKIQASNLLEYFDTKLNIIVPDKSLGEVLENIEDDSWVIDDKKIIVDRLNSYFKGRVNVVMYDPNSKYSQFKDDYRYYITDLMQIIKIINE